MILRYLTTLQYPSTFANRTQVMKMSEAFARQTDFALYVTRIYCDHKALFESYGMTQAFTIREIGSMAKFLWLKSFWLAIRYRTHIAAEPQGAVFYIRDILLAYFLVLVSKRFRENFFFECHSLDKVPGFFYRTVFKKARGIISTNNTKKANIQRDYGVFEGKILVAPNGFDDALFQNLPDTASARQKLGFDQSKKIVMYVGSMQSWKGIDIIPELAKRLPDVTFVIVGAEKDAVDGNVVRISQKSYRDVPLYMRAADILIAPYKTDSDRTKFYFSPIKLFEYMASGTPLVVTDLPAIREIISEKCCYFTTTRSPSDLTKIIKDIFYDVYKAKEKAIYAKNIVQQYTWGNRVKNIVRFIYSNNQ